MARTRTPEKASPVLHFPTMTVAKNSLYSPFQFGAVIKEHRKNQQLSQQELAEQLNVTRNTVVNWETDKSKPEFETIPALCALLDMSYETLFGLTYGTGIDTEEQNIIRTYRQLSPVGKKVSAAMLRSMLDEECRAMDDNYRNSYILQCCEPDSAAAGPGYGYSDEKPSPVFLRKTAAGEEADAIVRVTGTSMEPVYHEGDYVYIRYVDSAYSGEDVVCDTANGRVIKRMDDQGHLYSINKAQPFGKKYEDDHVEIRGKVLGVVSKTDFADEDDLSILNELFHDQLRKFYKTHGLDDTD